MSEPDPEQALGERSAGRAADPPRTDARRTAPVRVLLVDDQPLFRRAIATLIDEEPDFAVIGEAADGRAAIELARRLRPDLIVMDIEMPVLNGVEAVRVLRDELPAIKVVVLTVSESEDYLFDAIRFGAHGYLLKDLRPEQLYEMLRAVMRGEAPISPVIAGWLLKDFRERRATANATATHGPAGGRGWSAADAARTPYGAGAAASPPLLPPLSEVLTRREMETLQLVADGLSNKEIGVRLSITEGTVKNHVHNALEKLQLENRIQAAAYVVRQGLASRPGAQ